MASISSAPSKGKHRKQRFAAHIDMTPMVDLAFLLLTFFIMTTTLMKQRGVEIQQHASDAPEEQKQIEADRVLNLVLASHDQVYWYIGTPGSESNITDYSSSGIRKLLAKKKADIKDLYVFIKASDQSRYQNMIDVLDEIIITGVTNYAFLSLDPEDKKMLN